MKSRLTVFLLVFSGLLAQATGVWAGTDERFLAARDAARVGDRAKLERIAPELAGYELEAYVDYWRLLQAADIRLARHYLLYPNPWPKIGHLARRWHGHPVFPAMLALGGVLECRSNWQIYVEEFCFAIKHLTQRTALCESFIPEQPLTPFERKYLNSGHPLYRMQLSLCSGGC